MSNISDPQTEIMILAKAFHAADSCNEIVNELTVNDFFEKAARSIFLAIYSLTIDNKTVSIETIAHELSEDLEKLGGSEILSKVCASYSTSFELRDLIVDLKKTTMLRNLYEFTHKIKTAIEKEEISDPDKFLDSFSKDLLQINSSSNKKSSRISEILKQERMVFSGFETGFSELDKKIKGFSPGQLIIVGARPGHGKSTFMMNLIENLSMLNVLTFSLEMTDNDIAYSLAYLHANLDMNSESLIQDEEERILLAKDFYSNKNIVIDDQPGLTPYQIYSRANKMKQGKGLDIIFIDYLQLMNGDKRDYESNQVKVASISRELKSIAKKLHVPIVTLAQLNRMSEQRENKRPILSDLRESGSLEADADIVLLLHRPSYYNKTDKPGGLEVNVAKNRFGEIGIVDFNWNLKTKRMVNLFYEKICVLDESNYFAYPCI